MSVYVQMPQTYSVTIHMKAVEQYFPDAVYFSIQCGSNF